MSKKTKIVVPLVLVLGLAVALAAWYLSRANIPVLEPKGSIGNKERNLMIFTVLLGLVVVVPVFVMATVIAWRYREGNTKTAHKYAPDWDHNRAAEFTWWAIPIAIITVLSVVTWTSTYALDPWKPLASHAKPMTIQVVSLDWKWLFIYPEQHVASVNFVQFPTNTPVNFAITSDSVMNSFWVPQLGGQMYSMPGMLTQLHLSADVMGDYAGSSANISGEGFAGMKFTARASSQADFNKWLREAKKSSAVLSQDTYTQLAKPSKNNQPSYYANVQNGLYDTIMMKYMTPSHMSHSDDTTMSTPTKMDTHMNMDTSR
jgi:cytochrome o ubiquinol oxidase subunit 2